MKSLVKVLIIILFTSTVACAQSVDSIKFNIYDNFESGLPPVEFDIDELPEPVVFLLNDKRLKGNKFSELKINRDKIKSIRIIRGREEVEALGYKRYKTAVIINYK